MKPLGRTWISKTAMTRFVRCPYAFWLVDSGQVRVEDTVNEFQVRLMAEGNRFQGLVEAAAVPISVEPEEFETLLAQEGSLPNTPDFRNARLRIFGRPDGIEARSGALIPIEVKSHRDVQALDELELAFYWLLLEPYRTRLEVEPEGVLILRYDGQPIRVKVPITADRIERVMALLPEIRTARRYGVQPQICDCQVCSTLRRDEVLASVTRRRDTTLLFGVSRVYAQYLTLAGYPTWSSLIDCDPAVVAEQFSVGGHKGVTARQVQRWQLHARSYRANAPLLAEWAYAFPVGDAYLALDLEYDPDDAGVWLIGACLVAGEDRAWKFYWADSVREQIENIRELTRLVAQHSGLPVVTWSGATADIPILQKASAFHALGPILDGVFTNHVDAYQWTVNNLRFPVPGLSLSDVAAYFGVPRLSEVPDGLQALLLYQQYLQTKSPELKERLINYNRGDLEALISVTGRIREIATPAAACVEDGVPDASPRQRSKFTPSNSANDTVHAELEVVPRGSKGGPERRYRTAYAAYRLKALGRNPEGCGPTQEAAHDHALGVVRVKFPDFHPNWP